MRGIIYLIIVVIIVNLLLNFRCFHVEQGGEYITVRINKTNTDYFVFIMSSRHNGGQRDVMRKALIQTYKDYPGVMIKFVVGTSTCLIPEGAVSEKYSCDGGASSTVTTKLRHFTELQEKELHFRRESNLHGDIVELEMIDYYRNLPEKLKLSYKWGVENTEAKWFMKVDDDCFFDVREMNIQYHGNVMIGNIAHNHKPSREGKWKELTYDKKYYPPFPLGAGSHVVSRELAMDIVHNKDNLFNYQGEDVSLGIWAQNFNTTVVSLPDKFGRLKKCKRGMWACGHGFKTEKEFASLLNI
jgi:hypothetical protein